MKYLFYSDVKRAQQVARKNELAMILIKGSSLQQPLRKYYKKKIYCVCRIMLSNVHIFCTSDQILIKFASHLEEDGTRSI